MADTSTISTKSSNTSTKSKNEENYLKYATSLNDKVLLKNFRPLKEEFERKMRVLGQLKIAKRLRAVFEQAAEQAEKAAPEEAKKMLLEHSKNMNELVSLTKALRGFYTLDSYRFHDSIAPLNEKKQKNALQKSDDIISSHLHTLMKERDPSLALYDPQAHMNEEYHNFMKAEGEMIKSKEDSTGLEFKPISTLGNQIETNAESINLPRIKRRRRRKSRKKAIDFDDDIFDDNQYLLEKTDQQSKITKAGYSKKNKKKVLVSLSNIGYTDNCTIDAVKVKISVGEASAEKEAMTPDQVNDFPQGSSSSFSKKHKVSAILSDLDYFDGSNVEAVKVKLSVSGQASVEKRAPSQISDLTKGSTSYQNKTESITLVNGGVTNYSTGESIKVKVSIAGEESITLIGIKKKKTKKDSKSIETASSSSIGETGNNTERNNCVESTTRSSYNDSSGNSIADIVKSVDIADRSKMQDNANICQSESDSQLDKEKCSILLNTSPPNKKLKRRVNLAPRKCVNCNKYKNEYCRCHFWFMNGTKCGKVFCKECLTTKFDVEDFDSIARGLEWHCPSCLGRWARSTRSRRRK